MELQLVTFEQAKALKELGFPQETQYYDERIFDEDGELVSCTFHPLSAEDYARERGYQKCVDVLAAASNNSPISLNKKNNFLHFWLRSVILTFS